MLEILRLAPTQEFSLKELDEIRQLLAIPILRKFIAFEFAKQFEVKSSLKLDVKEIYPFVQQEAYTSGNMAALEYLFQLGDPNFNSTNDGQLTE